MVNRERTKFRICHARKQFGKMYVSGHVKVADFEGGGTAGIKFSKDFANFVGKELPHGLGEGRMAFIQVTQLSLTDWLVSACYTDLSEAVPLWFSKGKPAWLITQRNKRNEETRSKSKVDTPSNGTTRTDLRDGRV